MNALRVVEAACRLANFRRAGRELGVSHSAVSQQLTRIETQFDIKLFVRDGAATQPTAAAVELADGYRRAIRTLERSLRRATARTDDPSLVVSLPASVANPWLRHRLGLLGQAVAGARVEVRSDCAEPDFAKVDVAVMLEPAERGGLWVEHLFDRWVAPVCSPAFRQAHDLDDPEHLEKTPLLVHDEEAWQLWFAAAGMKGRPAASARLDPTTAIGAALDGYGVAMACRVGASTELEQGRLVRPFAVWAQTPIRFHLAWPEDHAHLNRVHAFADWMRAQVSLSMDMDALAA